MNSIYMYKNKINGHMYIGLAKDAQRRYKDHQNASFNPKHAEYDYPIHAAIRKYGLDNFDFIILEDNLLRSRDIWNQYFQNKITYSGFLRMWHGRTWKHIMPEVFENNPHRASYTAEDRDIIVERFKQSGLSLNKFQKTKECYVGYGTLYRRVHNPSFYDK